MNKIDWKSVSLNSEFTWKGKPAKMISMSYSEKDFFVTLNVYLGENSGFPKDSIQVGGPVKTLEVFTEIVAY